MDYPFVCFTKLLTAAGPPRDFILPGTKEKNEAQFLRSEQKSRGSWVSGPDKFLLAFLYDAPRLYKGLAANPFSVALLCSIMDS